MVALVTGGSRGMGRGIAIGLGEAGATVYLTGRSLDVGPLVGHALHRPGGGGVGHVGWSRGPLRERIQRPRSGEGAGRPGHDPCLLMERADRMRLVGRSFRNANQTVTLVGSTIRLA